MKSRLYGVDVTPIYVVSVTIDKQDDEYGMPYTYKDKFYFSSKDDARRAMFKLLKEEQERCYQHEVKILDDVITMTVKGCEYDGGDKVCRFTVNQLCVFNELPSRFI